MTDGFFAIDSRAWPRVYDLGLPASLAYLVMARGTGGDNRTTKWSVNAVEKYTGMRHSRSASAVAALIKSGLVREEGSALPAYYLAPAEPDAEPDWIWIPNTITDGAKGENPPIQLLRQTKNPAALRLFVDLYHAQNLAEYGGVPWLLLRRSYTREKVGESGPWVVFGYQVDRLVTRPTAAFVEPHIVTGQPKQADRGKPFFDVVEVLEKNLGLVEFVEHVVTTDDYDEAEIHHPYAIGNGEADEREYATAGVKAAEALLTPGQIETARARGLHLVPVHRHIQRAQLVGIARLRYRPKTRMTTAWEATKKGWANRLTDLAKIANVTHQGIIKGESRVNQG